MSHPSPLRPRALVPGDTVVLVSPSGPAKPEPVEVGTAMLESWGLTVVAAAAAEPHGYLAGKDDARLAAVNAALRDPVVRGLVCTRGGYGVQRIVDGMDFAALRADPKVVVGFSDITALQMAMWCRIGLASVHGPMAAWGERTGEASARSLLAALTSTDDVVVHARDDQETSPVRRDGPAVRGTLLGGNLSLLATSVGTPDLPDLTGAVLLLEEVDEAPYRVDRMLTHLRRAGALAGVAGVAVGQFTRCADGWSTTVVDVLLDRLGDLGVPVLGGLPVGHGHGQLTVPVGVPARLDVAAGTLTAAAAVR